MYVYTGDLMPKTKAETQEEYIIQKLPKSLTDEVDKLMGQYGYRSRSEFVKDAVRNLLRQYQIQEQQEKK